MSFSTNSSIAYDCADQEVVPEIYYLAHCASCEVFLLLANTAGLSVCLRSVNDHANWREMAPEKTVPFMVTSGVVTSNSRGVLRALVEGDRQLSQADQGAILDIQARWLAVADGYITNEVKGQRANGFATAATKAFSEIVADFKRLSTRGRIYAAAVIMPYLRRIHYVNQLRPDSLVLDENNVWDLLERECKAWHDVIISFGDFRAILTR